MEKGIHMKFYYNIMDGYNDPRQYYDKKSIRRFRVYPATPEIEKAALQSDSHLWPVHDPYGKTNEVIECKDIDEAYDYILESKNLSVYEYIHDI